MDVLFRHTILGEAVRFINPHLLAYAEECDPAILKNLVTLEDAQSMPEHADENSALLEDGEDEYGSGTLLVEWYNEDDSEAWIMISVEADS